MSEEYKRTNYDLAKAEADKVDEQIISALQNGISFRVEAGAGIRQDIFAEQSH